MMPSIIFSRNLPSLVLALLIPAAFICAQDAAQKTGFFEVQISKDEIYSYTNFKFKGDYSAIESPSGNLALGRTEAGVTIVVILGGGNVTIEAPEAIQENFKPVFEAYPLKVAFSAIYMRLNPKEYDETIGKLAITKAPSDEAYTKAKEIFDSRFLASYHAGPKAILPPYKTRVFEFETATVGHISYEEGYWLRLIRVSPYGKVYPSNYVNPKQKYGLIFSKPADYRVAE